MLNRKYLISWSFIVMAVLLSSACNNSSSDTDQKSPEPNKKVALSVYKSPTCGCCNSWVSHVEAAGFSTQTHHPADLAVLKKQRGIAKNYQSCHTAITKDGFVFEGHVPAKFIHQFLQSKPKSAIGLAVPAMPLGSPGMEVGGKFTPYQVLLLKADGSSEVYADILALEEQF